MTNDLVAFILARLDEDERIARAAGAYYPSWAYDRETFTVANAESPIAARKADGRSPINDVDGEHIARHDPARVLRDVEGKRRLVDTVTAERPVNSRPVDAALALTVLRLTALAWSDHPGYRAEWAP
jgi:Family of unknown function (DUF6221)